MYLPQPPTTPMKILPSLLVYNLYPCESKIAIDEPFKDLQGRNNTRKANKEIIAFANIVLPYRDAEAFRKSSSEYVDFGTGVYTNKTFATIKYHHFYGKGDFGGRYLTNVIIWHKQLFDGTNPETARMVIGDESTLFDAMRGILKHLSDIPFLARDVPNIVTRARASGTGAIRYRGNTEWASPVWDIKADGGLWNDIIRGII